MTCLRPIILTIAISLVSFSSCKKNKNDGNPYPPVTKNVSSPPYMSAIYGTHSFHYLHSGFNPITSAIFSDTSDVTVEIIDVDSTAIKFKDDIFEYDSTSVSGILYFHYISPVNNNSDTGYIHFNPANGKIIVYKGAGNETDTYESF